MLSIKYCAVFINITFNFKYEHATHAVVRNMSLIRGKLLKYLAKQEPEAKQEYI